MSQNPSGITYTANLRTKILDFKGFDSSRIFNLRGDSEFPGKFESTNLGRDNLGREILNFRGTP